MIRYYSVDELAHLLGESADAPNHWLAVATAREYAMEFGQASLGGSDSELRVSDYGIALIGSALRGLVNKREHQLELVQEAGEWYQLTAGQLILACATDFSMYGVPKGDICWVARAAAVTGPGVFLSPEELSNKDACVGPMWQRVLDDEAWMEPIKENDWGSAFQRLKDTALVEGLGSNQGRYCHYLHAICDGELSNLVQIVEMTLL